MGISLMDSDRIKIYTNESVSTAVAEGLRRRGIDAQSCRDVGNYGLTDEQQLDYARQNRFVVFTHDDDFLKLNVEYAIHGKEHTGIIYAHQRSFSVGECKYPDKIDFILSENHE